MTIFLKGELFFSEKNCTLDHFSFMTTALGVMSTNLFPVIVPRIESCKLHTFPQA